MQTPPIYLGLDDRWQHVVARVRRLEQRVPDATVAAEQTSFGFRPVVHQASGVGGRLVQHGAAERHQQARGRDDDGRDRDRVPERHHRYPAVDWCAERTAVPGCVVGPAAAAAATKKVTIRR